MRRAPCQLLKRGEPLALGSRILVGHLLGWDPATRYDTRGAGGPPCARLPGTARLISCGADPAVASAPTLLERPGHPGVPAWRTQIAFPTPHQAGRTHSRHT